MPSERPVPILSEEVLALCFAEASQGYPEEVCGLLLGPKNAPLCDEVRPCKNQQNLLHAMDPETYPRDAGSAYALSPKDIQFLDRSLSQGSQRPVKVIYHSHIDIHHKKQDGAYFSSDDKEAALFDGEPAYPSVDYLVLDCWAQGVRKARLFRYQEGDFVEVASYLGPLLQKA